MKEELRQQLLRKFVERGFYVVPLSEDEQDTELEEIFPLGRLKRSREDVLEIVEVQFGKYKRPRFVLNFGAAPAGGIVLPWGHHIGQHDADPSGLDEAGRLFSSSIWPIWFGLGPLSRKDGEAIKSLVARATNLSCEIDEWFESKSFGRHTRKFGLYR